MVQLFLDNTREVTTFKKSYTLIHGEGSADASAVADAFYGYVYQNQDLLRAIAGSSYKHQFYDSLVRIFIEQYRKYSHWRRPDGELVRMRMLEREY